MVEKQAIIYKHTRDVVGDRYCVLCNDKFCDYDYIASVFV